MKKVRKWEWEAFTNPARKDGAVFHHWRRTSDEPKAYLFAQFNKQLNIPTYTANEYNTHLKSDPTKWSKPQTVSCLFFPHKIIICLSQKCLLLGSPV